jgi:DNA-binding SARP family transcriptional activator
MTKAGRILLLQSWVYKVLIFAGILCSSIKAQAQGLQFNSNDSLMEKRTSYSVFKQDKPAFNDHLSIRFDLALWDNSHLGYVLSIADNQNNSYSLSYIYLNGAAYLNFNIDSKSNKLTIPLSLKQLSKRTWIPVKIDVDLKKDRVTIWVNNQRYDASGFGFTGSISPAITFGKNARYSDVPNMAIRNLEVGDASQTYSFPLNEWEGQNVHSSNGDDVGFVENPVWLINESYFWKPLFSKSFSEVAGLNFNQQDQSLLMFGNSSLTIYDIKRDEESSRPYNNALPMSLLLGKSIINPIQNKLYAYEVSNAQGRLSGMVSLDLKSLNWEAKGNAALPSQRHHHNIFYDKNGQDLYLFGGYGLFRYYNDFFKFDTLKNNWQKVVFTGDHIDPRFFSACSAADANNDVYIFGGIGNQSGNQVVGGMHFYDLYRVNLATHAIKKLWTIKPKEEAFVPANNLVPSKDGKYFYVLCYPHERPKTSLKLYKYSIKDGSYEVVSGEIPVTSERIETDVNLFFNSEANEFYCATQEFTSPVKSGIKIYSLAFPPVSYAAYLKSKQAKSTTTSLYSYVAGLAAVLLVAGGAVVYLKRKKAKPAPDTADLNQDESALAVIGNKVNAVYLLGAFTVYDKNGKDITYLFSPKIKQLFILILLNSRDKNGVTSRYISTTLWADKDVAKTKNIRGVTLNHLRSILADLEGIELAYVNDTYSFTVSDTFFCDYFVVQTSLNNRQGAAASEVPHFHLIARGGLLPAMADVWLDDFKEEYEEALMPALQPVIKNTYDVGQFKKALEISRLILNIDPFSDAGIKYKLKAIRRTRGIEHARRTYDDFIAEYKRSLGIDYPIPFDKICGK